MLTPFKASRSPLLAVEGASKAFGGVTALRELNLEVFDSEVLAIIGPNGAGKTTLFNAITGLLKLSRGKIIWLPPSKAIDLVDSNPWDIFRHGIARTFQNIRIPAELSVLDNVMIGALPATMTSWTRSIVLTTGTKKREAAARELAFIALGRFGKRMELLAYRPVAELSYADRRRVELARAIVSNPKLILLDEPAAGMNLNETSQLADDIKGIRKLGTSIVLIEHKLKFISGLADRVVVLNFGEKIAEGTYEQVKSDLTVREAYLGRDRSISQQRVHQSH